MPPVGFEPTISAGQRPQTYALDRAATGTSKYTDIPYNNQGTAALKCWKSRTHKDTNTIEYIYIYIYIYIIVQSDTTFYEVTTVKRKLNHF